MQLSHCHKVVLKRSRFFIEDHHLRFRLEWQLQYESLGMRGWGWVPTVVNLPICVFVPGKDPRDAFCIEKCLVSINPSGWYQELLLRNTYINSQMGPLAEIQPVSQNYERAHLKEKIALSWYDQTIRKPDTFMTWEQQWAKKKIESWAKYAKYPSSNSHGSVKHGCISNCYFPFK